MPILEFNQPGEELRTCQLKERQPNDEILDLFKFQTFAHNRTCETDFQRFNKNTGRYETAGMIEWKGNFDGLVTFGVVTLTLQDVRKAKKATSTSRRFSWHNSEYRWRREGTNGQDLVCHDWLKRRLASYNDEKKTLDVSDRGYAILDQVVVTCLLHRWMLSLGYW